MTVYGFVNNRLDIRMVIKYFTRYILMQIFFKYCLNAKQQDDLVCDPSEGCDIFSTGKTL